MFFLPDTILLIWKRSIVSSIAAAVWLHCCFVLNEDMLVECFHSRGLEDESMNEKDWILNCMDDPTGTTVTDIFEAFLMSVDVVMLIHLLRHDTANPGAFVKR